MPSAAESQLTPHVRTDLRRFFVSESLCAEAYFATYRQDATDPKITASNLEHYSVRWRAISDKRPLPGLPFVLPRRLLRLATQRHGDSAHPGPMPERPDPRRRRCCEHCLGPDMQRLRHTNPRGFRPARLQEFDGRHGRRQRGTRQVPGLFDGRGYRERRIHLLRQWHRACGVHDHHF